MLLGKLGSAGAVSAVMEGYLSVLQFSQQGFEGCGVPHEASSWVLHTPKSAKLFTQQYQLASDGVEGIGTVNPSFECPLQVKESIRKLVSAYYRWIRPPSALDEAGTTGCAAEGSHVNINTIRGGH